MKLHLPTLFSLTFLCLLLQGKIYSQTIFLEEFDETEDATVGTDDFAGTVWSTDCPSCSDSGDFFKVSGGKLRAQDTNGPASWTTEIIDISSCENIEIEFDLAEEGTMEACGTGCNSVDWVQLEYNIDGAGWTSPPDATFCDGPCADVMVIQSDDIDGGSRLYTTGCLEGGSEMQVRITVQAWAGSERWIIDNLSISCSEGPEVSAGIDQIICEGDEIILTAYNPDGALVSWDHGVIDGIAFEPGLGIEDYIVTADDGICSSTDTVLIEVTPTPVVSIDAAGPFGEASGTHILTASPIDGTWSASCGDCINPVSGEFNPATAGVGIWEVCYVAGVSPCLDSVCITIEVEEDCLIESDITSSNPTCYGMSNGYVSITLSGTTGEITYTILNELDEIVNSDNNNYAENLDAGWYYFEIEDEYPCFFTDSIEIVEPEEIMMDLEVLQPNCADELGEVVIDTVFNYAGVFENILYEWSPIAIAGEDLRTMSDLLEGTYNVQITDENGCEVSESFEINIPLPLDFDSITLDNASCSDYEDGRIEMVAIGGTAPYTYSIDGASFEPVGVFEDLESDEYDIVIKDDLGCTIDSVVEITAPEAMIVETEIIHESCVGFCDGAIQLEVTTGIPPFSYSIDDCTTSNLTGNFSSLCAGDYTVCIEDGNGCTYNSNVTVVAGLPVLDGTIIPPSTICEEDAIFPIDAVNAGTFSGPGVIGSNFDPNVAGVGSHLITNTFDGVCSADYFATFTVLPSPNIDFTTNDTSYCTPSEITLYSTNTTAGTCYWEFGDGVSSFDCDTVYHTYLSPGNYDITLTYVDVNGCSNSKIKHDFIQVLEQPIAAFSYSPQTITTLDPTVHFDNESISSIEWEWSYSGILFSESKNPTFEFPEIANDYLVQLIAKNEFNCTDTTLKSIRIEEDFSVFIPNAFTPDDDPLNQEFKPYFNGIDIYNFKLAIYNRWGELLFESYDVTKGWNGTYGDNSVEQGVYIYHIVASEQNTDKNLEYHGHVTVLR